MHTQAEGQARRDWMDVLEQEPRGLVEALDAHPDARRLFDGTIDAAGYIHYLLRNLGCAEEAVEAAARTPAVEAYTCWNFFTSRSGIPTAFLGTAYVLEYLSVTRATGAVERLLQVDAIPNIRKSVTFLRSHGSLDAGHVEELTSVLRLLTDPEEQAAVLLSARTTRALYPGIFREP